MANPTTTAATNSAQITTGTSVTVSSTGSVTVGNLQVVILVVGGSTLPTGLTAPGGWTTFLATTSTASSSPLISAAVFYKPVTTAGSFSGSFSWTNTASSGEWLFMEWTGQNLFAVDGSVATSVNATSTTPTSPSVTPNTTMGNDTLVCALCAGATSTANTTVTIPTGMTSIKTQSGASGTEIFGCASLGLASAAATGTKSWTLQRTTLTMGVSFLIGGFIPLINSQMVDSELVREVNRQQMIPVW